MLSALSAEDVEYLLVGAMALATYGHSRSTGDMDIWVNPTPENAARTWRALARFGAPVADLTPEDLATPGMVFQIGVAPNRIDVLTSIEGVTFGEAWPNRHAVRYGPVELAVLGRTDLARNKRAAGRPKDLADLDWLERGDRDD
ncbi:MAG TPA: hypothetical protein VJP77_03920 [Planctomycetota bacterium]|nr:hypothetical protein [Planctomycetota bacterium]